jgi:hypothetical protein
MKKTVFMLNDGTSSFILEAEEGKLLRHKKSGWETRRHTLDYFEYDEKSGKHILELPEDFEEVDEIR